MSGNGTKQHHREDSVRAESACMESQKSVSRDMVPVESEGIPTAVEQELPVPKEPSKLFALSMKFLLTFVFVPMALWFNVHVFLDITINGRWDFFGETEH